MRRTDKTAAEVRDVLLAKGWRRLTDYPDDGSIVNAMMETPDGKIVISYENNSFLIVKKVTPR